MLTGVQLPPRLVRETTCVADVRDLYAGSKPFFGIVP